MRTPVTNSRRAGPIIECCGARVTGPGFPGSFRRGNMTAADATSTNDFLARVKRGPAYLLLGQDYLRLGSDRDPLLALVASRYADGAEVSDYASLLSLDLDRDANAALAWLDERCRRIEPPEWLSESAAFAWSGVYSSAIDTVWPRAFRQQWRDMQPIYEERYRPGDPRNRMTLHYTFLYGSVSRATNDERPPLTEFEYLGRSHVATAVLRRLPETLTPLGTLAIEGYAGARDWLTPEQFAPILATLGSGQVHLFSASEELAADPLLTELGRREIVVVHTGSLAQALNQGVEAGRIRFGPPEGSFDRAIEIEAGIVSVPKEIWSRITRTAGVLDDTAVAEPRPLSDEARYRDFRTFLGSAEGLPRWVYYARGFAFERESERRLGDVTMRALESQMLQDRPIILHGQTGNGKTVALAALARRIRVDRRYPVLFIERQVEDPAPGDIALFCEWAEQQGAPATLVVWDGMREVSNYRDLTRYLTSRGRKVVVVGSSYRLGGQHRAELVEMPPRLTENEIPQFRAFLELFDPELGQVLDQRSADESFLVALYRLLPPTRSQLRTGVTREATHAESVIAERAAEAPAERRVLGALAQALLEAGLIDAAQLGEGAPQTIAGETLDDFQVLTGLVMVPGRFGLRVPLELLLRTLGQEGFANFLDLVRDVDLFRWFEDRVGNIEIGARSALEARLIAETRLGGPAAEAVFVRRLLREVRDDDALHVTREIDFAVDLVRAVGANVDSAGFFKPYHRDFAGTLTELREERGVANPRLMLQEANLRREAARQAGTPVEVVDSQLEEAENIVRTAVELTADDHRSRFLRSQLLAELATIIGTRARQLLDRKMASATPAMFVELRDLVRDARREDPNNFYPVDVLAWVTRDLVNGDVFDGGDRLEVLGDALHALQTTEVDELDGRQVERFHMRRHQLAELAGDVALSKESLRALRERGSGAGLFLQALGMSGLADLGRTFTKEDYERVEKARAFLEADQDLVFGDPRCLGLYLDLWWISRTGERFFSTERSTPPLGPADWDYFLRMITILEDSGESGRETVLGFLRGLALFQLERVSEAMAVFREVERQSTSIRSRRRVIRSYLASTPEGRPRLFHGTVSSVDRRGRKGELYVDELRRSAQFLLADFRMTDAVVGESPGDFHIAFNFLGPVADPVFFAPTRADDR